MILWKLFWTFFKIGAFTFGGGYAMIPLIQREVVEGHRWLTMEQFTDIVAISEMTPGPISINAATFVGYRVAGPIGAILGTLGTVLPSFFVILAIATFFLRAQDVPLVQSIFKGLRPAVAGLIVVAALNISRVSIIDLKMLSIALSVIVVVSFFKVHPIAALSLAGIIGAMIFR